MSNKEIYYVNTNLRTTHFVAKEGIDVNSQASTENKNTESTTDDWNSLMQQTLTNVSDSSHFINWSV